MTATIPFLRNSERSDLKSCQQKWWWGWNFNGVAGQGLVNKMPSHGALWFGTGWHLVWAMYYTPPPGKNGFTRGRDPHETWEEYCKNEYQTVSSLDYWGELEDKEWFDAVALGHIMIDSYMTQYKGDPEWEVLMPEQRFSANIPYNTRQLNSRLSRVLQDGELTPYGKFITRQVGTFDMPIRNHSWEEPRVEVVDHKTTNRKENVKQLTKADQPGTYISVGTGYLRKAGLIHKDEAIMGAIWSYARKAKPPDPETTDEQGRVRNQPQKKHYIAALLKAPLDAVEVCIKQKVAGEILTLNKLTIAQLNEKIAFHNMPKVLGDVSQKQPGPLFWRESVERGKQNRLHQIERIADDAEQIAMLRAGIMAPSKNPGDHCNWCPYSDLCDLHENRDETTYFIESIYKVEDRYADHREGAINSKSSVINKQSSGLG